ncbi:ABC-type transport system permease protein [Natronoarchaeum philippinense]|uniref:ABC-type transport system permease protein n=1 Tax=Natronoarchaeum philippinense TaxID=558529 RepID=A0A285N4Z4_NATPI|nr:PrsW family intramembrane metalloprotease [Natronoarchaeum philippinense]SNZ04545.1 ABC-type transport system permease protein [Natronoarchaeum philippinense]
MTRRSVFGAVAGRLRGVAGWLRAVLAAAWTFARKSLRIARWEVTRSAGTIDRRTVVLGAVGALLVALVAPAALGGSAALDEGIYRVGVDESNPYHPVVENSSAFRPVEPEGNAIDDGEMELLIEGSVVRYNSSIRKSEAAYSEFSNAVEAYNYELMRDQPNQTAAFPVTVDLRYVERPPADVSGGADAGTQPDGSDTGSTDGTTDSGTGDTGTDSGDDGAGGTDSGSGGSGDGSGSTDGSSGSGDGQANGSGSDNGSDTSGSDSGSGDAAGGDADGSGDNSGSGADDGSSGGLLGSIVADDSTASSPAEISPPFPMQSLVLAFLFIVPMNFVIQLYSGSIMNERINRRGELMLVSPVGRGAIVTGKTLPYLLGLAIVSAAIALAIGGGPLSVAAVVPLAALFLSAAFVGAMFSRSFKELTFVTVTISVGLSSYAFVPAIFTNVTPIALISPLTLVVWDLQGEAVTAAQYAFSTGPLYLTSTLLFALGAGVYREEDMFSQRAVHLKAMDALANYARSARSVFAVTALSIPFVLIAELLAIAILFALPLSLSAPVLLLSISVVEEIAKSLHVYAGFAHNRWPSTLRSAAVVGAASGAGFFVGEKATHVVSVVGITSLDLGRIAFPQAAQYDPAIAVVLFFLPLALHAVTAIVSAVGARRGRWHYVATLVCAIVLHTLYNLGVTSYVA